MLTFSALFQIDLQYIFNIVQIIRSMRKSKVKPSHSPSKQNLIKDNTEKKLQFLLPSSKEIILANSSIKYNASEYNTECSSKKDIKTPPSKIINLPIPTQNKSPQSPPFAEQKLERTVIESRQNTVGKAQQSKIIAQTFNCLDFPIVINNTKAVSAVYFPRESQQKHLTSLNNIILTSKKSMKQVSGKLQNSNQQMMCRITKLQKLVSDLINGKIIIPQQNTSCPKSVQCKSKSSLKLIEENKAVFKDKRSNTYQPMSFNKCKSKTKLKLDFMNEQKKCIKPRQIKIFSIKKKGNLKIGPNYQSILNCPRETIQLKNITNFTSSIAQPLQKSNGYSKIKSRTNFIPNIINL